jgi:dimeric dUTPase (all-alpha-NTP-PPase superfamily)
MLSLETIKKLQNAQEKLDEFIVKKNNITDIKIKEGFIRTKIALLVEIGELANELETFKHWKKNKKPLAEKGSTELAKAKEELIDCLHFYLSWANSFGIDFADYKFKKLISDPNENELLLAFFSETEKFSLNVPWKVLKPKLFANHEKSYEEIISKLNPDDEGYEKNLNNLRKTKEKFRKDLEKMNSSFLEEIEVEKNKTCFYHWLIIFEELAQKLGMKNEADIYNAYMAKNKINWERQQKNY